MTWLPVAGVLGTLVLIAAAVLARPRRRRLEGEHCPVCHSALEHHADFVTRCTGPDHHTFDKRYIWERR